MKSYLNLKANIALWLVFTFLLNTLGACPVCAQEFVLPAPGQMVSLSPAFSPAVLKGIKLDPKNPFRFHFFVDRGDSSLNQDELKQESAKLIKYFLASLTIPEKDLWVNLSPYEKDRIVPQEFGQTEMGRDLLAEDYLLKQITASLIYPESRLGKEFWKKVYAQAQAKYGTTDIPINTFNKVWIVPEKAVVYENGGVAFVLENHLKVMLEQDYLSLQKHTGIQSVPSQAKNTNQLGSQIVREIVIPALTKEVNEGKNFSQLRQVFYSLILATWYKKKIKDSILNKVYSNRNKIGGVNVSVGDKDRIYQEYLKAFKKGVYNYIKEEPDPITNEIIPMKYFSGGVNALNEAETILPVNHISKRDFVQLNLIIEVSGDIKVDQAMNAQDSFVKLIEQAPLLKEFSLVQLKSSVGYGQRVIASRKKEWKKIISYGLTWESLHPKSRFEQQPNAVTQGEESREWAVYLNKQKRVYRQDPQMVFEFTCAFPTIPDLKDPKPGEVYSSPNSNYVLVWRYIDLKKYKPSRVFVQRGWGEAVKKRLLHYGIKVPVEELVDGLAQENPKAMYHSEHFAGFSTVDKIGETLAINSIAESLVNVYVIRDIKEATKDPKQKDFIKAFYALKDEGLLQKENSAPLTKQQASVDKAMTDEQALAKLNPIIEQELWGRVRRYPPNIGTLFFPYTKAGFSHERLVKIIRKAFSTVHGGQDNFKLNEKEQEAIKDGVDQVVSHGERHLVITSFGPGYTLAEPLDCLRLVFNELKQSKNKIDTITVRVYDGQIDNLLRRYRWEENLNESVMKIARDNGWQNKLNVEMFYGDTTSGDKEFWSVMALPSNITILRHNWVLGMHGIVLNSLEELVNILRDRISVGTLIVNETAISTTGSTYGIVSNEIIRAKDTAQLSYNKGGIDLNPAQMSMQIKKERQDFKFNFNGTEIDAAQVTGATFTIRTMMPVTNLPQLLGLNMELADNKFSSRVPS